MRRALTTAVVVACAAAAAPATAATPFVLSGSGGRPQVTVDNAGNGHFVWNEGAPEPDATRYCKVPPGGTTCSGGEATFLAQGLDDSNNTDFDGPRVLVAGSIVVVLTHRCCGGFPPGGGDGIVMYVSTDGGTTFSSGEVVGNQNIAGDAIIGPGPWISTISDVVTGGTFYQAHTRGTFNTESANLGDSGPAQSYSGSLGLIDASTPIATFDDLQTTFWRRWSGTGSYNDSTSWTPTAAVGPGDDGTLAHGTSGVWLLYRTGEPGSTAYVARPFVGTEFGTPVRVTETGDPIFADFFQDAGGRFHAVWLNGSRALTYRRSDDGTSYGPVTELQAPTFDVFHPQVGAGADGEGWAVWDSNSMTGPVRAVALEVAQPQPTLGETVAASVVSGEVFIRLPAGSARASQKGSGFVPLTEARTIPVRSILDTRRGTVRLRTARNRAGQTQSGQFTAGVFQVLQSRKASAKGLTELRLTGSAAKFKRCGSTSSGARASRLSRRAIRRLRGNARGRYRTRGRHSAATVRGTVWDVTDRCDGTLTKVKRGKVTVRDFRRKKTIVLTAGKRYLARAPR